MMGGLCCWMSSHTTFETTTSTSQLRNHDAFLKQQQQKDSGLRAMTDGSSISLDDLAPPRTARTSNILLTTLCVNKCHDTTASPTNGSGVDDASGSGCRHYQTPMNACFHGPALFPNDPSWNATNVDILDTPLNTTHFQRDFYPHTSTIRCQGTPTDGFVLPYHECVGPFGPPRPWGIFQLLSSW